MDYTTTSKIVQAPEGAVKLIEKSADIWGEAPTGNKLAFTHAVFCQVGLPRRAVKGDSFIRKSGDAWLHVQAGMLDEGHGYVIQPVPYGAFPRIALAHITTMARRHKTKEIALGDSAAEFLRVLEMPRKGASYRMARKQMHALAACRLQMGCRGHTYNGQPVQEFDAWLLNTSEKTGSLFPGCLTLSDDFYNSIIMGAAVPIDMRALLALKGSSLAMDFYFWLTHRLYTIGKKPVFVSWKNLRLQFGQEYQGPEADKNFKKAALPALREALAVYPQARVSLVHGGLLLHASPPPVQPTKVVTV
jgi:hypothetical protein